MNFRKRSIRSIALALPVMTISVLFVQCGDGSDGNRDGAMDRGDTVGIRASDPHSGFNELDRSTSVDRTGVQYDDEATRTILYPADRPVPATPAEERSRAGADMRGLRAILMADLEEVRNRLNDGTSTEGQKERDQAHAAELAQGLERVDRALIAMDATTDATWSTMRTAQLKEVDEVRAWMVGYREKDQARR